MDFIAVTNRIFEMDRVGEGAETLPLIREMLAQPYEVPQILMAGVVYSLATTKIVTEDCEVVAKWQICQIDKDRPLSRGWVEFCDVHLRMGYTLASKYKRVWEVFVVELGYSPGELAGVGINGLAEIMRSTSELTLRERIDSINGSIDRESVVYFIQSETGPIKIGQARNPDKRLQSLQCASPCALTLLGYSAGLGESIVHGKFAHLRIRGEWYQPASELLDFIEEECGVNVLG